MASGSDTDWYVLTAAEIEHDGAFVKAIDPKEAPGAAIDKPPSNMTACTADFRPRSLMLLLAGFVREPRSFIERGAAVALARTQARLQVVRDLAKSIRRERSVQ